MNKFNSVITSIQNRLNSFFDNVKKKAKTEDDFIVMYFSFLEKYKDDGLSILTIRKLRNEIEFSNFSEMDIIEMFAKYQNMNVLRIGSSELSNFAKVITKYNSGEYHVEELINTDKYAYMPTFTNYGRETVISNFREKRWVKQQKFMKIFGYIVSVISASFIIYKLYLWIFKQIPPIDIPEQS